MNLLPEMTSHFMGYEEISRKDISDFLSIHGVTNENSVKSTIYRWVKSGVIQRIGHAIYKIADQREQRFAAGIDETQQRIAAVFAVEYPGLPYCIWSTECLNSLMIHQHFNQFYILEAEYDVITPLFYTLKDQYLNVYLLPDDEIMGRYVIDTKSSLIIKKLVTRAPLVKTMGVSQPSLEKILVDIFADKNTFGFLQGAEMVNIFNTAFDAYVVNSTRLVNYAARRGVTDSLKSFVQANVNNPEILSSQ